jgi:hypothetical protein
MSQRAVGVTLCCSLKVDVCLPPPELLAGAPSDADAATGGRGSKCLHLALPVFDETNVRDAGIR